MWASEPVANSDEAPTNKQSQRHSQKARNLQRDPAYMMNQNDSQHETNHQQQIDGGRSFGCADVLGDKSCATAKRHGSHDRGREDADAVG